MANDEIGKENKQKKNYQSPLTFQTHDQGHYTRSNTNEKTTKPNPQ
jgi:hypothetical protein